jgi:DNA polymerase-3 subunit gamma/tau
VKFLLATTDPQKVPVTVLSRCLQFNLKRLPIDQIQGQFNHILDAEGISYEPPALFLLARAADGSMRDGLSLLDQAIGYGGGAVREDEVKAMLGVVAVDRLPGLLEAVHAGDGADILDRVQELGQQAPDFGGLLRDLLTLLHRVAVLQAVPDAVDPSWGDPQRLRELAAQLAPEDVQLYYQIGLLGQRDLPLAPDPRSGFEMTLLRMLAFRPTGGQGGEAVQRPAAQPMARNAGPAPAAQPARPSPQAAAPATEPRPAAAVDLTDWHAVLPRLGLGGMAAQLANNCTVVGWDGKRLELQLAPVCQSLLGSRAETSLRSALAGLVGGELELRITVGEPATETPAQRSERNRAEAQQRAVETMRQDPVVKVLEEQFDAELMEDSIRPVQP